MQLEKQKKHLAAYYGHDDQAADSDAEVRSVNTHHVIYKMLEIPEDSYPEISGHACIMAFYINVWDTNGKSSLDGFSGGITFIL